MNREQVKSKLTGCYIAIPTIFDKDEEVDLNAMRRHVRWLIGKGVKEGNGMILVGGAAGEFATLTLDERKEMADALCEEAAGRVPILIGVQGNSTREVVDLARHAARAGATAVQMSPPFYYTPTDGDVYDEVKAVAEAADIGIILYQTWWKGYRMPISLLEKLAQIDQVVGLKWSAPDWYEYEMGFRLFKERLSIIDNQLHLVYAHMLGARGLNTHPSNFWPEWGINLWNLLEAHKYVEAQAEVEKVIWPFYDVYAEAASYTGGEGHVDKLCLELVGLTGGVNRRPTRPLPPQIKEKLRRIFVEVGVPRAEV